MVRLAEVFYALTAVSTLAGLALSSKPNLPWALLAVAGASLVVGIALHSMAWAGASRKQDPLEGKRQ